MKKEEVYKQISEDDPIDVFIPISAGGVSLLDEIRMHPGREYSAKLDLDSPKEDACGIGAMKTKEEAAAVRSGRRKTRVAWGVAWGKTAESDEGVVMAEHVRVLGFGS